MRFTLGSVMRKRKVKVKMADLVDFLIAVQVMP